MSEDRPGQKTKLDRVKEAMTILKKLKELGIRVADPGYIGVKDAMTEWINTGEPVEKKIEFPFHGRVAELELPWKATGTANMLLKAPKKQEWQKEEEEEEEEKGSKIT